MPHCGPLVIVYTSTDQIHVRFGAIEWQIKVFFMFISVPCAVCYSQNKVKLIFSYWNFWNFWNSIFLMYKGAHWSTRALLWCERWCSTSRKLYAWRSALALFFGVRACDVKVLVFSKCKIISLVFSFKIFFNSIISTM